MNRRTTDAIVVTAIALVLLGGLIATWQAWQASQASTSGTMMDGMMMDGTMGTGMYTGPSPAWLLFGTIALAAILGVGYVVVRKETTRQATTPVEPMSATEAQPSAQEPPAEGPDGDQESGPNEPEPEPETETESRPAILDVLPEDERRILEPVIESPGLTQIEVRDRSDFSKSKVSQTVSDLEKRGLLSRERQGRTYRIYPGEDLSESE